MCLPRTESVFHSQLANPPQQGCRNPLLLKIAAVAIPTLLALGTFFFLPLAGAIGATLCTGLFSLFIVLSCCSCSNERVARVAAREEVGRRNPPPPPPRREWPENDFPQSIRLQRPSSSGTRVYQPHDFRPDDAPGNPFGADYHSQWDREKISDWLYGPLPAFDQTRIPVSASSAIQPLVPAPNPANRHQVGSDPQTSRAVSAARQASVSFSPPTTGGVVPTPNPANRHQVGQGPQTSSAASAARQASVSFSPSTTGGVVPTPNPRDHAQVGIRRKER